LKLHREAVGGSRKFPGGVDETATGSTNSVLQHSPPVADESQHAPDGFGEPIGNRLIRDGEAAPGSLRLVAVAGQAGDRLEVGLEHDRSVGPAIRAISAVTARAILRSHTLTREIASS
jgi:hypothetical protein